MKLGFGEGHIFFGKHCCSLKIKINKQIKYVNKHVPCTVSILNLNNDQPEQPNNPTCMSTVAQKRSLHIKQNILYLKPTNQHILNVETV